jgi:hypothetical protein
LKVIFIENKFDYQTESSDNSEEKLFVCYDWMTWHHLKGLGENLIILEDYVDRQEGRKIQIERLDDLKNLWYKNIDGQDLSSFQAVSLGGACNLGMRRIIAVYFRLIIAVHNIMKTYNPDHVVAYVTSPNGILHGNAEFDFKVIIFKIMKDVFKYDLSINQSLGEEVERLSPPDFNSRWFQMSPQKLFVGKALEVVGKLFRYLTGNNKPEVLLVSGSPHKPIWEMWSRDHNAKYRLSYPLNSPPRRMKMLLLALRGTIPFIPRPVTPSTEQLSQLTGIRVALIDLFETDTWAAKFHYEGVNCAPLFAKIIQSVIFPSFNDLAITASALQNALKKKKYKFIIVPDITGTNSKLLLDSAFSLGIDTYYWLHGFTERYLYSDIIQSEEIKIAGLIVWGDHNVEGYKRTGIPSELIHKIPPPFFDRYVPISEIKIISKKNVLLLGCSPTRSHVCGKEIILGNYIIEMAKYLKSIGVKNIILKIHPGAEKEEWFREVVKRSGLDIGVKSNGVFIDYIEKSDYVIGGETTGALEALMMGKNYYMIDPEELHNNGFADQVNHPIVNIARNIKDLKQMISTGVTQPQDLILQQMLNINSTTMPGDLYKQFDTHMNELIDYKRVN